MLLGGLEESKNDESVLIKFIKNNQSIKFVEFGETGLGLALKDFVKKLPTCDLGSGKRNLERKRNLKISIKQPNILAKALKEITQELDQQKDVKNKIILEWVTTEEKIKQELIKEINDY